MNSNIFSRELSKLVTAFTAQIFESVRTQALNQAMTKIKQSLGTRPNAKSTKQVPAKKQTKAKAKGSGRLQARPSITASHKRKLIRNLFKAREALAIKRSAMRKVELGAKTRVAKILLGPGQLQPKPVIDNKNYLNALSSYKKKHPRKHM